MPAPIDIQVSSPDIAGDYRLAREIAAKVAALPETGQIYIPQDMDYPRHPHGCEPGCMPPSLA